MENPFLHPGFIVPTALGLIAWISWQIRLEAKVGAVEKAQVRQDQSLEDTWKDLESHRANEGIHFNQRVASEVDRRQSERFGRIEGDLKEIKDLIKGMAGK